MRWRFSPAGWKVSSSRLLAFFYPAIKQGERSPGRLPEDMGDRPPARHVLEAAAGSATFRTGDDLVFEGLAGQVEEAGCRLALFL
jgi:hypothetical protein